jgi:hypothetical protein
MVRKKNSTECGGKVARWNVRLHYCWLIQLQEGAVDDGWLIGEDVS